MYMYKHMKTKRKQMPVIRINRWNEIFDINRDEWKKIFTLPFKDFTCTKMRWFQYRINNHILGTNKIIFKMGKTSSPYCTFCELEVETIFHLLWDCSKVSKFIEDFKTYCTTKNIHLSINGKSFIFGSTDNNKSCVNNVLVALKFYIYKSRCLKQNLSLQNFLHDLKQIYKSLKCVAIKHKKIQPFKEQWSKWAFLENI